MIYIDTNKDTQIVYVPRNGETPGEDVRLVAESTADRTAAEFAVATCEVLGHLLRLVVGLPDEIFPGEWQYALKSNGADISTGLMIVTEDSAAVLSYNREIKYKQYGE